MMKQNFRKRPPREEKEFDQKLVDLARVTRVTKGGKQMSFRATIVIGDRKGRVGFGIGKSSDVSTAISKAAKEAKKTLILIPLKDETIPHEVYSKFGAGKVMLKPATKGKGVKVGGAMRVVFELAGVPNVTGKILGSKNKINTLYATFEALKQLRK
ncbi:30S ribosomal protein S5 [Candidatus Parcubacteria bacterium]|nr:30S ribosomal protein S5 [Candidatus Parcubacteria bacterium]